MDELPDHLKDVDISGYDPIRAEAILGPDWRRIVACAEYQIESSAQAEFKRQYEKVAMASWDSYGFPPLSSREND